MHCKFQEGLIQLRVQIKRSLHTAIYQNNLELFLQKEFYKFVKILTQFDKKFLSDYGVFFFTGHFLILQ